MRIDSITQKDGVTAVTITYEDTVILSRVFLVADGKKIGLERTVNPIINKASNGEITKTRTLEFHCIGKKLQLKLEKMTYTQKLDKYIEIPIN